MPCIHPSEDPPLGWLVPCLAVADLGASLDFYAKLDLIRYGGDVAERWAMLRSRAVEVHLFQGHIPQDLVNFRGADVPALRSTLAERGLSVHKEFGPWSVICRDPDGRDVFFDSSPAEHAEYETGRPLTGTFEEDDVHAGEGLDLGNMTWCLTCQDLAATQRFYETLGMVGVGGEPGKGWSVLGRRDHPVVFGTRRVTTRLALFQGMIPRDALNFRGGNVAAIADVIRGRGVDLMQGVMTTEDGGEYLSIEDPDGRPILFDTTPPERLYA